MAESGGGSEGYCGLKLPDSRPVEYGDASGLEEAVRKFDTQGEMNG